MTALLLALLAGFGIPDGTYTQACRAGSRREEVFAGEQAVYVERNYADASCGSLNLEVRSYGRVEFPGTVLARPRGASAVDFSFSRVTLTPRAEWVATLYRERALCGRADWEVGRETEITGLGCDFFGTGRTSLAPSAGDRRFGVFRMGALGELYLGRLSPERDGGAPERRPLVLDALPYEPRSGAGPVADINKI